MTITPPAIRTEDLVKNFGDTPAVRGVSLEVPTGTVLGLLGPNGAGKTTIVRMLSTLVKPDGGRALVHGYDTAKQSREVRSLIGMTGQYAAVDEDISGWENLYLIGRLLNMGRKEARSCAGSMLERFRLTDAAHRPVAGYSGGMRRRLDLAASLMGEPRVLFLDEPTTGLDPHSRNELWEEVRSLKRNGATVLLTTQYMEEAEALADAIVVIDHGRIIASGTSAELRERIGGPVLRITPERPADLTAVRTALIASGLRPSVGDQDTDRVSLPLSAGGHELTSAIRVLGEAGLPLAGVDTHVPSLDEVFLTLTGTGGAGSPSGGPATNDELTRSAA
ncbi:ATP-binding cassette domain-containing protein [Streptomyces sp. NBC_01463]|uniref:ATP-binding cassette domain-containing protein n=1 Tax=Streptomyces sp. RTGN2 TaxID=3016525 RepID=UPI002555AB91|nr:ATP-binding cassette domain-containing protein [Streptomyces sp. RTGN2]